jgi:hypothetical protein
MIFSYLSYKHKHGIKTFEFGDFLFLTFDLLDLRVGISISLNEIYINFPFIQICICKSIGV